MNVNTIALLIGSFGFGLWIGVLWLIWESVSCGLFF